MIARRDYEQLAQCIRSGQMDASEIQEALRDEVFARWYANHYPA